MWTFQLTILSRCITPILPMDWETRLRAWHVLPKLRVLDKHINDNKPWAIKDTTHLQKILTREINELREIINYLEPFIPETASKLSGVFGKENIALKEQLFPRL